jgi:hypothetical protein
MSTTRKHTQKIIKGIHPIIWYSLFAGIIFATGYAAVVLYTDIGQEVYSSTMPTLDTEVKGIVTIPITPPKPLLPALDKTLYDSKLLTLANGDTSGHWPVKTGYPTDGAILPFNRIVAFYGNFYSTKMGVLGEYEPDVMIAKLKTEMAKWQAADPLTPVIPALHYIAVTAQGSAGADGKYRARMPYDQIDKTIEMAKPINALVFVDIQPALSTVQVEVPLLEKYLSMPNVHLGIDPEFYMKTGKKPGTVIGTMNADDINYVTGYLADLVKKNHIPPKIFVIHRFTQGMVRSSENIILRPEVQIVMDMDGWGPASTKIQAYQDYIRDEPVEFTGFKLFYKNDFRVAGSAMMTPAEVLKLIPAPSYIQYQ